MEQTIPFEQDASGERDASMAFRVVGAYKKFGTKGCVLKGLNMNVKERTIYSLLGPSGCGKTTLLSCLIGRLKLDSGNITTKISKTSQIGYMPQDLALFQEFSIEEHLLFYGYVHSMKKSDIMKMAQKLIHFLDLPPMNAIVSTLSGGQQRRVSLCIALLHNPEVLILDEPTVGIDIVLSESIWEKLVEMSTKEGKTVIITTHYIQEARRSNTVGLMRNGKMLEENDPATLMNEHGSESLEEVFLKLCQKELILNDYSDEDLEDNIKFDILKNVPPFYKSTHFEWNRVLAYSLKSLFWMRRNLTLVLFTLLLPIVQTTLMSITVGDDPRGLTVAVVNDEILDSSSVVGKDVECNENSDLSLDYLNRLRRRGLQLAEYADVGQARKAVEKNDVWGALYINPKYSASVFERLDNGPKASAASIIGSEVMVWLDMSSQIIGRVLKKHITESAIELFTDVTKRCNFTPTFLDVFQEEAVYGNLEQSFRQFMTPANAVLFSFYLPMMFTLGAMLMEKNSGLLERGLVAGLTLLEISIGHIMLQGIIMILQTALMMIVLYITFENSIDGGVTWSFLFLLLVGVCGLFYGFFVAALCDSFTTASCLAVGSYFPLFILSGAIWPLEGMFYILRLISAFIPITSSVEAYRSISVRSWSVVHPQVYTSLISLTIWTLIFGLLTVALIKHKGR